MGEFLNIFLKDNLYKVYINIQTVLGSREELTAKTKRLCMYALFSTVANVYKLFYY